MKKAFSLKYGSLVNAVDIDYSAFKDYLLVCPHCKEPVFLVAEKHRKEHKRKSPKSKQIVTVKAADVSAAFSHYSDADITACENYTKSLTPKAIFKINSEARNQRKEYFEQHFLQLMHYNKTSMKNIVYNTITRIVTEGDYKGDRKKIKGCLQLMKNSFMRFFRDAKYLPTLHREKLYLVSVSDDPMQHFELFNSDPETISNFIYWAKTFDLELQYKLCDEVFQFLSTNTAQSLGYELLDLSFYRFIIRTDLTKLAGMLQGIPMTEGMVNIVDKCIQEFTENIAFTNFNFRDTNMNQKNNYVSSQATNKPSGKYQNMDFKVPDKPSGFKWENTAKSKDLT